MWNLLAGIGVVTFVGYVLKRRFQDNQLQSVWWELMLVGVALYLTFTIGMTVSKTWTRASDDLASYRDDYENCRDPLYRNKKAKAGSTMCPDAEKHHLKSVSSYTRELLHEMGLFKLLMGYSPVEIFVNLTESSYWTFAIVFVMFATVLSVLVWMVKTWNKAKQPSLDWSKIEIRDKAPAPGPKRCRDVGGGKEACLPF